MSFCIKIYARQCPPCLPSTAYDADGRVCLDTFPGERYSKSKTVTELSDFGKLKSSTVRQFSLPASARNRAILKSYGSVTALNFDNFTLVPVTVFEGSSVALQSFISINKKQAGFDRWDVSLTSGGDDWIDSIGSCNLCDIPNLGLFQLTKDNIRSSWFSQTDNGVNGTNAPYQDGDQGLVWPLVHYGGWTVPATYDADGNVVEPTFTTAPDFRPWIYLLKILQEGFCKLGYKLKAPIFETEWGRRLIVYALGDITSLQNERDILHVGYNPPAPGFVVTPNDQTFIPFTTPFQIFQSWLVPFDDESAPFFDAAASIGDGYYDTNNNCVINIAGTYCFEICFDAIISQPTEQVLFWLTTDDPTTGTTEGISSQFITLQQGQNNNVCYSFDNVEIASGTQVKASIAFVTSATVGDVVIVQSAEIKVKQKSIAYEEGAILDIASMLDCTCTLEDILAGALHLIGKGKIQTDHLTRTVCIYPPENIRTPTRNQGRDEAVEGFFLPKSRALDMRGLVVKNSECVTIGNDGKERFLRLCFKGEDAYLESQGFGGDNKPYSSVNDLGDDNGFTNDTAEDCNPTFDATGMIVADDINLQSSTENSITIPALWDNTDNEISWDLGKRILLYQGYRSQTGLPSPETGNASPGFFSCNVGNGGIISTQAEAPIAYHESDFNYQFGQPNDLSVTYSALDRFTQRDFYRRELLNAQRGLGSEYLFLLNNCLFRDIDFRRAFYFEYNGKPLYFWPTQIRDFRQCENIATPVQGYPENKQLVICPQINIPPFCSQSIFPIEDNACDFLVNVVGTYISSIFTTTGVIQGSQFNQVAPNLCDALGQMLGGTWSDGGPFGGFIHYQGTAVVTQITFTIPLANGNTTDLTIPFQQVPCN